MARYLKYPENIGECSALKAFHFSITTAELLDFFCNHSHFSRSQFAERKAHHINFALQKNVVIRTAQ